VVKSRCRNIKGELWLQNVILAVSHLSKKFGGIVAVSDVSFSVIPEQIKAIIGPNGAGKTTTFNLITGVDAPTAGEIRFKGMEINGMKPHEIASKGISRTFQNVELFNHMSVLESVMVGRHPRTFSGLLSAAFRLPLSKREEEIIADDAMEWLVFFKLDAYAEELAANLPFGQQRILEFARAMATNPALLLLDEPAAGLNLSETEQVGKFIQKIREMGVTIILVEHDMSLVMDISDEIIVLNYGKLIAEGTPREIQNNPDVIAAYLGE
jgi:branched-chain amino acid transport system ATP-binding protein